MLKIHHNEVDKLYDRNEKNVNNVISVRIIHEKKTSTFALITFRVSCLISTTKKKIRFEFLD